VDVGAGRDVADARPEGQGLRALRGAQDLGVVRERERLAPIQEHRVAAAGREGVARFAEPFF